MTTLGHYHSPQITVHCVICLHHVPLSTVTAGSLYADGQQAFACSAHLAERRSWIIAWAIFDHRQRQQREIISLAERTT